MFACISYIHCQHAHRPDDLIILPTGGLEDGMCTRKKCITQLCFLSYARTNTTHTSNLAQTLYTHVNKTHAHEPGVRNVHDLDLELLKITHVYDKNRYRVTRIHGRATDWLIPTYVCLFFILYFVVFV